MKRLDTTYHHNKELLLYRAQHDNGKVMDAWYYTINIPSQKTIKDKSTKQSEFSSALMFAETQYQKLKERAMMGISISEVSYKQVWKKAHEYYEKRVAAKLLSKVRLHRFTQVNKSVVIPYFEEIGKDFAEINTIDIENWIVGRKAKGQRQRGWHHKTKLPDFHPDRSVSNGTINIELQMIRMVYDFAEKSEMSLPGQRPSIKSIKNSVRDNRRPHFTWSEWNKITTYLTNNYLDDMPPSMAKSNLAPMYAYYRRSNQYFWQLLFMTMCRVGELKTLRWGNIEERTISDKEHGKVKRILLTVDGKVGKRQLVAQPYAKKLLDDWKKISEEFNAPTGRTDLVFKHPDTTNQGEAKAGDVIEVTNVAFKRVLKKLGLSTDPDGKQRTVYSIRHTAITQALRRNVPLQAISHNAGVSIETLMRAYDHTESSDYIRQITQNDFTGYDANHGIL